MVQGIVLPAIDTVPVSVREFVRLEDYQEAVGGWIEAVDVPDLGIMIYVNEEGLIHHLPFNSRASFLWWYHVPAVQQAAILVGEAVVVGMPDPDGNSTDVPAAALTMLAGPASWGVLLRIGDEPAWATPGDQQAAHVMPLVHGDPNWVASRILAEDYFSACAWAIVLKQRWVGVLETKLVPAAEITGQGG